MELAPILKDKLKPHTLGQCIDTEIGIMLISLNKNHLACNFFGSEERAKSIFGHWKVNTFVSSEQDIQDHINFINEKIDKSNKLE